MPADLMHIYGVSSARPITADACERRGYVLYMCAPMSDLLSEPTHYFSVVGIGGAKPSDAIFMVFPSFGVFSYQWLTYYMREVPANDQKIDPDAP